jgi:hypothetical protein
MAEIQPSGGDERFKGAQMSNLREAGPLSIKTA